jgi:hypothetical protein
VVAEELSAENATLLLPSKMTGISTKHFTVRLISLFNIVLPLFHAVVWLLAALHGCFNHGERFM